MGAKKGEEISVVKNPTISIFLLASPLAAAEGR
jgi:hypothetical protein